ncbi:endonuclease/exonuclease/phosphatase family protein [Jannaschia sp. M317]|uniref:endonuclease/exonuclease/phosphatase family protein n=1 Tax=Jannaschia sp. M317 TaxID=2867011 RepID=UPI0021A9227C|nr:endonuclease/exonuclease/phosphatase family protein [Jannaschia sp. M317]UWQ19898.1 endonuclease/exonuclease/phosphatase family protein [Jannaschia sp. M317]
MRIMCLNGWGGTLHAEIAAYLTAERPEVLCLQEVVHGPGTARDWLTYRDGDHVLPQRANSLRDMQAALPEHQAMFCPAARGVLWDDDEAVPSFWGLATFVHRSLPVIAQAQGFVHGHYGTDGYGAHPRSRTAHAVRIWDHDANRAVSVTQMHGLRDLAGKHDTPERSAQARRLIALSDRVSEPGDLRVLCGDFNVGPDSQTLTLLGDAGFTELVTEGGHLGTRTSHYPKPARFADYMAVDDPGAVHAFVVVRAPEVSDHCPLILTL